VPGLARRSRGEHVLKRQRCDPAVLRRSGQVLASSELLDPPKDAFTMARRRCGPRGPGLRRPLGTSGKGLVAVEFFTGCGVTAENLYLSRVARRRTSGGRVTTISCSRDDTVPQSGHAAAAGQSVTVHTSTAPPGPAAMSATRRPSTPNSADAASWNTMPGTAKCPHSAGQFPAETCSTALP
jgi:hypothetical protein